MSPSSSDMNFEVMILDTYIVVEHSTIWGMILRGEQVDSEEGCLSTRT